VVRTNELGFPGPLYPPQKGENVYRIFVTGEAFESAEGVDNEQAWPRLLEDRLNNGTNAVIRKYAPVYGN